MKPGESEPVSPGAEPSEKQPGPGRAGSLEWTGVGGGSSEGSGTGPLTALPLWRTGEGKCLLKEKTKENSNPALEDWDLGKLNPLCKREQGDG